jgi:hypothetical protein
MAKRQPLSERQQAGMADPFIVGLLAVAMLCGALVGIGLITERQTGNVPVCVASTFAQHEARLGKRKDGKNKLNTRRVDAYCRCLDDQQMTTKELRTKLAKDKQQAAFGLCTGRSLSCEPGTTDDGKTIPLVGEAKAYCACLKKAGVDAAKLSKKPAAEQQPVVQRCLGEAKVAPLTYTIDTTIPVH